MGKNCLTFENKSFSINFDINFKLNENININDYFSINFEKFA